MKQTTKERLRITYLLQSVGLWGGVKIVVEQANRLAARGHLVQIVTIDTSSSPFNIEVPVSVVPSFSSRTIPESDLIVGTFFPTVRSAYDCRQGIPVHFCQGFEGDFPEWRQFRSNIDFIYRLDTVKLANNAHLKQLIEQRYGHRCYLIKNGIDTSVFYPRQHARSSGRLRIGVVGPYEVPWKGIRFALEAIAKLKSHGAAIELVRVSQTPMVAEERALGVVDSFYVNLDPTSMAEFYNSVDLVICPSLEQEGFGLPALEAMACGTPTILTEISSFLSFDLDNNGYALFVPPGDSDALAQGITFILDSPEARKVLAQNGQEVAARYDWDKVILEIEERFRQIYEENVRDYIICSERAVPGKSDSLTMALHKQRYQVMEGLVAGLKVLDVGCGVGYGTQMLGQKAQIVIGIDHSEETLEYAVANFSAPNVLYIQADALKMPFLDNSFDAVICFEVLEHVEDYQGLISECLRVLKPGGMLAISTPNKQVYSPDGEPVYKFHLREWYLHEFVGLMKENLLSVQVFGQRVADDSLIIAEPNSSSDLAFTGIGVKR